MANFLISYPRSGNTWVRYCIEFLSDKPTTSLLVRAANKSNFVKTDAVGINGLIKNLNVRDPAVLIKRHHMYSTWRDGKRKTCHCNKCQYQISAQDKVLLLVRNFRESVFRHVIPQMRSGMKDIHLIDNLNRYMDLVYFYDKFCGSKMIMYYEDLITDPVAELRKACDFLGILTMRFDELSSDLDNHRTKALCKYGFSKTGGDKISYHANNADPRLLKLMNDTVVNIHSDMLNKHLKRYK